MAFDFDDFRDQAHRLLREKWRSPEALAQEMYAMLLPLNRRPETGQQATETPREQQAKREIAARGQTPTDFIKNVIQRARSPERRPDLEWKHPEPYSGSQWANQTRVEDARPEIPLRPIQADTAPFLVSGDFGGYPASIPVPLPIIVHPVWPDFVGPEPFIEPKFLRYPGTPYEDGGDIPFPQDPSGTSDFLGQIVSGSGDTYSVALYPNGKSGPAGDTVSVKVPQIDPDDDIPSDTWIAPVMKATDPDGKDLYIYQPPIWLS